MRTIRFLLLLAVPFLLLSACSTTSTAVSTADRATDPQQSTAPSTADDEPTDAPPSDQASDPIDTTPAPDAADPNTSEPDTGATEIDAADTDAAETEADSNDSPPNDADSDATDAEPTSADPTPGPTDPASDPEPTATTAPTTTDPPASDPEPTATAAPDAAPEPTATAAPVAAPEPTATATPTTAPEPTATTAPTATPTTAPLPTYFGTLPPRSSLPSDAECATAVLADPRPEVIASNAGPNSRRGGPTVEIDGAQGFANDVLAARITGDFSGTTEEILRWAACKWGIDEDLTRARAWTESSWSMQTQGDWNESQVVCDLIGLDAPCPQSHGLLQVKGTIHEGTYPRSTESTAWGVDYAMAWQRACFEGAFTWLNPQGYSAGDMRGCVGAWFSGEWYDDLALAYLEDVDFRAATEPWRG